MELDLKQEWAGVKHFHAAYETNFINKINNF